MVYESLFSFVVDLLHLSSSSKENWFKNVEGL